MKTFTAFEFARRSRPVYAAANEDGKVVVNHNEYPDVVFEIVARPRHQKQDDEKRYVANRPNLF